MSEKVKEIKAFDYSNASGGTIVTLWFEKIKNAKSATFSFIDGNDNVISTMEAEVTDSRSEILRPSRAIGVLVEAGELKELILFSF